MIPVKKLKQRNQVVYSLFKGKTSLKLMLVLEILLCGLTTLLITWTIYEYVELIF